MSSTASFFPRVLLGGLVAVLSPFVSAQRDARQAFDLAVPLAPTSYVVDGRARLGYELHLTNFAAVPLRLTRVDVFAEDGSTPLVTLSGGALAASLGRIGPEAGEDASTLAPGVRAIVYLDLAVDAQTPPALRHRVEFQSTTDGTSARVEGGRVAPRPAATRALGAPLRGGPWVAVYSAEWTRGHRRVLYAVDGRARIPGRHAIDWIKLDAQGGQFAREGKDKRDWYGYGADVLAVADATVAAVRDDVAEPVAVSDGNPAVSIGDASGNYVALALADGRYAFYEHLKPGSIKVRRGERVRRGDVLAALGYTGQSTGPHLHFHLADAPLPLAAEGLPYAFEGWRPLGAYVSAEAFGKGGRWSPPENDEPATRAFPAPFAVVEFTSPAR
ncbi:M23 family metallopeptidase [Dokdonella sp.]|uniref:M23 family metallopeptidase n=1 Tax=Dokdonella sp. TaxID=2291710 RepID=UPI001B23A06C|nr:M23 family metallopeptidase [Dokdonella sp.]MBO9662104.1 peptidoglycan DD-metalloendopeptidase family protein [Dokdonella sp.]